LIYTYTQGKSKSIYITSVGQFMSFMKNLGFQFFKKIRNVLVQVHKELEPQIWFCFGFWKKPIQVAVLDIRCSFSSG